MFQTALDFLQEMTQCLTKPSFSLKMYGWTAQRSHQASVGKGAAVVFVEQTLSSICSMCIFVFLVFGGSLGGICETNIE